MRGNIGEKQRGKDGGMEGVRSARSANIRARIKTA